jgi:hypothetical protein
MFKVTIESERGWGAKVDEVLQFNTKDEAEQFVEKFNSQNDLDYVPDWYMYAALVEENV